MKKIFTILIFSVFFIACDDVPVTKNTVMADPFVEITEPENTPITEEPVVEEPVVEEPVIKNITGYGVEPIDETADFYFLTTNDDDEYVSMYKFNGYEKSSIKINGIVFYDDDSYDTVPFIPYEFFTRDINNGKIWFSWMIKDEYRDEDGVYHKEEILYFSQKDEIITQYETWKGEYYMTFEPYEINDIYSSENFTIISSVYDGGPVRDIQNIYKSSGIMRFYKIWGVKELYEGDFLKTGLFFNVRKSGREPAYYPGLYFWPKDRISIECIINAKGKMWIN